MHIEAKHLTTLKKLIMDKQIRFLAIESAGSIMDIMTYVAVATNCGILFFVSSFGNEFSKDGKVCSGSGKCSYDEQEKVTFCKCDEGFLGKNCAVSCASRQLMSSHACCNGTLNAWMPCLRHARIRCRQAQG